MLWCQGEKGGRDRKEGKEGGWTPSIFCQGAQNIGLSNRELKSVLKCTVWSQCMPVPDGWTNIVAVGWRFVLWMHRTLVMYRNLGTLCLVVMECVELFVCVLLYYPYHLPHLLSSKVNVWSELIFFLLVLCCLSVCLCRYPLNWTLYMYI